MSEIRTDKLNSNNYSSWKQVITAQLKSKDLWDYVAGTKLIAKDNIKEDEKAKFIILASMDDQQINRTGKCGTSNELWLKIQDNFCGTEESRKNSALLSFLNLKTKKGENLMDFCGRYEAALADLEATKYDAPLIQKLYVLKRGPNETYKTYVKVWVLARPKGTIEELVSALKVEYHTE